MASVTVPQVSFSKGEVSPIAAARTDEEFYSSAVQTAVNFFIRREGAASNRPGLQYIANAASNTPNGSYLVPFVYNNAQSYLTEWAAGSTNVYLNGGSVQSGIGNPYALADLPNLRWAQSADTLSMVVATQPMQQLKRVTPSSFTLSAPQLLFGPFQDTNTDGTTTVYASGTSGTVTLTASSGIFTSQHVGALFYLEEQFLSSVAPWEPNQTMATGGQSVAGALCRSDGKIYIALNPPGSGDTQTGTFQPVHESGTQWDGVGTAPVNGIYQGIEWQFLSSNAGIAKIVSYISSTQVRATIQSHKGIYANFPPTVVGGPVTAQGPWNYTASGSASFSVGGATTADPNQFYVTVAGIFQDPSTYSISGATLTFNTAPANGAAVHIAQVSGTISTTYMDHGQSSVQQMRGLCLSTYWAFGSISAVQGYPSDICYYNDRLVLSGTLLQPQTIFTSKVSDYLNYGVSSPQVDSDAITETINARQQNPINNLLPLNNLLLGTASASWRVTDSSGLGAITPSNISLLPQEFYGMQPIPMVQTGSTVLYAQWGGRKIRDLIFQFYTDKFQGTELTVYAGDNMFPFGTTVTRMAFAPEPYGLIFCVRSDGVMCVCAYLPEQKVLAWTRYITSGNFEDVCVIPENGTFSVYVIVGRTVGGTYQRFIERFAPRETTSTANYFFVDSGLTYNGPPTTTFSGMGHLAGQVCSVFADGVVQPTVTIAGDGTFTLNTPASVVNVGLSYTCQLQGMNFNVQNGPVIRDREKSIPRAAFAVDRSFPFYTGQNFASMYQVPLPNFTAAPYTGVMRGQISTQPDDNAALCVQHTDPTPLTLCSWIATVDVGDQ